MVDLATSFLYLLCFGIIGAIGLLAFPLPFTVRRKTVDIFSGLTKWIWGAIVVFLALVVQEYFAQRAKESQRLEKGADNHFLTAEMLKHQRNLYLYATPVMLAVVLMDLIKLLSYFLYEHSLLQEKLSVERQRQSEAAENAQNQ
jgi:hypothetical protein